MTSSTTLTTTDKTYASSTSRDSSTNVPAGSIHDSTFGKVASSKIRALTNKIPLLQQNERLATTTPNEKTTTSRVSPELTPFSPSLKPMYANDLSLLSSSSSSSPVTHGFSFLPQNAMNYTAMTNACNTSSAPLITTNGSLHGNNNIDTIQKIPVVGKKDQPIIKVSALDALAALASQQISPPSSPPSETLSSPTTATRSTCTNHHQDALTMPPPPPRLLLPKRNRSASNPEGMEKWDVYKNPSLLSNRRNFGSRQWMVLPSTILEEELKSAHDLCREHRNRKQLEDLHKGLGGQDQGLSSPMVVPVRKIGSTDFSIYQQQPQVKDVHGNKDAFLERIVEDEVPGDELSVGSKASSKSQKILSKKKQNKKKNMDQSKVETRKDEDPRLVAARKNLMELNQRVARHEFDNDEDDEEEEPLNEFELDPEELLRRARSRLLDDLSAENGTDKGVMAFPHSLDKYKEVYNKNGRIGIYTPAERAAIIAKFNSKRTRRTWKKKIRYNCRKNLADRRMRVKGRFVKRSVEETAREEEEEEGEESATTTTFAKPVLSSSNPEGGGTESSSGSDSSRGNSPLPSTQRNSPLAPVKEDEDFDSDGDVDMPDVNDPDAGFAPTDSLPYRRMRRHTIT
mmetsp:Transcript_5098/g.9677  ORF Transcript_5098/g.9677 Transcript_5098/m.9677 type:complete len:627 (+) Transcript_5098:517-2397(+)|eukprot:CAMPEP_0176488336 /NCGR_PEP_ID=MMETSP0200_2-20121128/6648_1 /TAXON_ID=947934 /ORGANISM="Chaetoceros sp., Strain GSL56" /LENGTH=626 /DNA_ID=CAMNT_0017885299 /DNA_START=465 /DNA_END=2345 /DNA_ORIENTATION=-